jgi:hypothetical protein
VNAAARGFWWTLGASAATVLGVAACGSVPAASTSPLGDSVGINTCRSIVDTASQYGAITRLLRAETSTAGAVAYWQEHTARGGTSPFETMQAGTVVTVCLFQGEFVTPVGPPPVTGSPNPPHDVIRLLVYGDNQVVLDSSGYVGRMSPDVP